MTVASRFWGRVTVAPDGCWIFGTRGRDEYGTFTHRRRTAGAHRVSWELSFGTIPDGLFVLHACDVPACVNPDHLFLGTVTDNRRDCQSKGRFMARLKRLTALERQQCRTAWWAFRTTTLALMRAFGVRHWQIEAAQKGLRAQHGVTYDQTWRIGHWKFHDLNADTASGVRVIRPETTTSPASTASRR